ncbi:DNA primase [Tetragenococcus halophilus]|uniref:DNA primase n=1 Tax=Tetragenococcus halophilus (strain DSM 20338 / JCM 20259 / NCIMB 9735 / NBRC 12172) TaxID=945021 RepID=A0AAN1SJ00_TETHN|nr:DNA primase [Tetragenococcus halophilus]MCO7026049.1 DNA primase [Tetragenococcus halophilus]NRR75573.1 DNA primase [Tetragenococcus halophilus]NWN99789.1 DNA primase [Tetragenococcus halophilus]QXN87447.1 DNA primase [Tetragenococcus halophilus]RQD33278.1 DNA primase [Tetragenococcus halophilus subsp. halophilus DSM 20339]
MARIPQQVIDDVREKTNVVDVIGQYVQLKKSGSKNYSGLCPFHNEKTPSFSVAEDKQFYYCFGCGRGGNVFSFIQEIEGLSFVESVIKVAELEGIEVAEKYQDVSGENEVNSKQQQLIQMHEKAAEVYHHMLVNTAAGEAALDYLHKRGLDDQLIEEFNIGFAPNQRDFLSRVFQNESLNTEAFPETGLFVERENGDLADRFYQRIMFPIRNYQGKTVGFSGRFFATEDFDDKEQPKYLNSPETTLFNKREILFNFDKARSSIRKNGTVYLFEGFMDVLAAYRSGATNGIASMGTSLTNEQIAAVTRLAQELVLCYDGDEAGVAATDRAIGHLQESSHIDLSVISVPEKLDPDEYVKKYGQEAFMKLLEHGKETVFSFKMRYRRMNKNMSNEKEQVDYVQELLHDLLNVDSLIEQDRYLTQLSTEFQISRETLQQQLRDLRQQQRSKKQTPKQADVPPVQEASQSSQKKTQVQKAEELLLYRLFNDETLNQRFKQAQVTFVHEIYQELYMLFDAYIESEGEFVLAKFLDFLKDDQRLRNIVSTIASLDVPEEGSQQEFEDLLTVIQSSSLVEEIKDKRIRQQEASQKGNQQLELDLAVEIINLTKKLKQAK